MPYLHWWPRKGTTEWVQYDLAETATLGSATVYWFDDAPWGGCRVPKAWRVLCQDEQGQWTPVDPLTPYTTAKGEACTVTFRPVTTKAVRLEVQLPDDNAAGLYEWELGTTVLR